MADVDVDVSASSVQLDVGTPAPVAVSVDIKPVDVAVDVTTVQVDATMAAPVSVEVDMAGPPGAQGAAGPAGPAGADGVGIPAGGAQGQLLVKTSSADYASGWGQDAYSQSFSNATTVDVVHNLHRYPSVTVFDSAGDECIGEITHISNNELMVKFSSQFSGTIACN